MKKRFIPNPLERFRKLHLHHKGRLQKRKYEVEAEHGWTVRYRDEHGRFQKFDPRIKLVPEYYLYKTVVEDTDLPRAPEPRAPRGAWVPARETVLGRARAMAKAFMEDPKVQSEYPYNEWELQEKGPVAYKWLHADYKYLNDHQRFDSGNYCVFYILIAVFGEEEATFMVIRKTVMFSEDWTVERAVAEQSTFDDLGRDYVQRQGHLWTSEAMSPQIVNVAYVGFLGFTLFPFVPLSAERKRRKRMRPSDYARLAKREAARETARELRRRGMRAAAREVERLQAQREARSRAARARARRKRGRR